MLVIAGYFYIKGACFLLVKVTQQLYKLFLFPFGESVIIRKPQSIPFIFTR